MLLRQCANTAHRHVGRKSLIFCLASVRQPHARNFTTVGSQVNTGAVEHTRSGVSVANAANMKTARLAPKFHMHHQLGPTIQKVRTTRPRVSTTRTGTAMRHPAPSLVASQCSTPFVKNVMPHNTRDVMPCAWASKNPKSPSMTAVEEQMTTKDKNALSCAYACCFEQGQDAGTKRHDKRILKSQPTADTHAQLRVHAEPGKLLALKTCAKQLFVEWFKATWL
mmetsp:Transcript_176/g.647  ORF Transcript_176/g.647 Transcript_176/m.647 type:complete len:223 (-) Transcript_176:432-1100(-)